MNNEKHLKKFIVFAYSKDENLLKFCEYMKEKGQYNEGLIGSFGKNLNKKDDLSLFCFLRIIHLTNSWIELRSICHFIYSMHLKIKKRIEYKEYGCIVYCNFIRYNYSLIDRINVIKNILKENI